MLAGLPAASTALLHLTNIGTLFAFVIVCAAVLIMRKKHPDAERPFRCPWVPVVPILGILTCLLLMFSLPAANWWRLFVWLADRLGDLLRLRPAPQRDGHPPRARNQQARPLPGRDPDQSAYAQGRPGVGEAPHRKTVRAAARPPFLCGQAAGLSHHAAFTPAVRRGVRQGAGDRTCRRPSPELLFLLRPLQDTKRRRR